MAYVIKTLDGAVVRKTATRPYVEALVYRNAETNEVFASELMSAKAKHFNGQIEHNGFSSRINAPYVAKWETVVAVLKGGK
jgi:hypothetical protein